MKSKPYTPRTIMQILSGLHRHMREKRHDALNVMNSKIFSSLRLLVTLSESYIVKVCELARNLLQLLVVGDRCPEDQNTLRFIQCCLLLQPISPISICRHFIIVIPLCCVLSAFFKCKFVQSEFNDL